MISFERCQGCKGSPVKIINHAIPPVNHLSRRALETSSKKKEREKKERRGGEKRKSGVIRKQAAKARTSYCTDAKVYPAFNASHCIIPVIYKAPGVIIRNRNRENS